MMIVACCYGATLAGYVPLTALVPSLAPNDKGAAMSVLNLGSGLAAFVGPLVVTVFIETLGVGGVMWIFLPAYIFVGAFLTSFLTPSQEKKVVQELDLQTAKRLFHSDQ
ncbi:hypothetical protein GCM10020331_088230 [Ectobacillus funiculus]